MSDDLVPTGSSRLTAGWTDREVSGRQTSAQAAEGADPDVTTVEVDCTHWFSYPGFAEWYANLSLPVAEEEVAELQ